MQPAHGLSAQLQPLSKHEVWSNEPKANQETLPKQRQPTCYGLDVLLNIGPQLVFDSKGLT